MIKIIKIPLTLSDSQSLSPLSLSLSQSLSLSITLCSTSPLALTSPAQAAQDPCLHWPQCHRPKPTQASAYTRSTSPIHRPTPTIHCCCRSLYSLSLSLSITGPSRPKPPITNITDPRRDLWVSDGRGRCDGGGVGIVGVCWWSMLCLVWCLLVIGGFFFFFSCFVSGFCLGGVCVMVGWWWLLPC